ncbi:unnamed protein product [Chondrus crispus]|uniref:Uncharacterized protein n=1 Tax=Chondrus crispus TaxID=2769 RepID=R7QGL1_CHOCR|nr:unnamed protein product [Chondrus crispus]CDF37657.1 unnamed protein product [Chondrus crispus]|eukprot:XP_005717528.1 unnamed protein product [Chondrus crispus]
MLCHVSYVSSLPSEVVERASSVN